MILVDMSSAFHKCTHGLVSGMIKETKQDYIDLKQYKKEFFLLLLNCLSTNIQRFREYQDEILICLDETSGQGNWRKKIYPMYKNTRGQFRQQFKTFSYADAYELYNEFIQVLKSSQSKHLFRVMDIDTCEADDLILVLGRYFAEQNRPVMILSPDKDFVQLQSNPLIRQYSWMTNKMITPEDHNGLESWLLEHVCLGDSADAVPRIVDFKEFKPGVKEFLVENGLLAEGEDAWDFSSRYFDYADFECFDGVFEKEKFGLATLKKKISEFGSLEGFLDAHPVHRKNYYRNRQLVLEEGIPYALKDKAIQQYLDNSTEVENPATKLVEGLGLSGMNLPDMISNKYISETQLADFLDW